MVALRLEVIQGASLEGLGGGLRSAVLCYGQPVYTAPGLLLESPIRLAQLPMDADLAIAVLPPLPQGGAGGAQCAPMGTAALPLSLLRSCAGPAPEGDGTLPPGSLQWCGWLALQQAQASLPADGEVPPQLCCRVTFEQATAAQATEEQPAWSEEVTKAREEPLSDSKGEDEGSLRSTPSFHGDDPSFALERTISELSGQGSVTESSYTSVVSPSSPGHSSDRRSTADSQVLDERTECPVRFGSFRLSSGKSLAALMNVADMAVRDLPTMKQDVPTMKQALDLAPIAPKTASPEPDPSSTLAQREVKPEGSKRPVICEASGRPMASAPERELRPWPRLPVPPAVADGPARRGASGGPPAREQPAKSSGASATELDRIDSKGMAEAEVMKTAVGRLYSQVVQVASGMLLEKWASKFDQVISGITQGATSCSEVDMAATADKSTEMNIEGRGR